MMASTSTKAVDQEGASPFPTNGTCLNPAVRIRALMIVVISDWIPHEISGKLDDPGHTAVRGYPVRRDTEHSSVGSACGLDRAHVGDIRGTR